MKEKIKAALDAVTSQIHPLPAQKEFSNTFRRPMMHQAFVLNNIRPSEDWRTLFEYYNSKNERKLGMGCRPCFHKVYTFCKQQYDNNLIPE